MKKIIVKQTLCLLLCCCSIGIGFSQSPPTPIICNDYHSKQLIIQIDKTPPTGNKITGTAAFTSLGGVSRQSFGGGPNQDEVHLVEFDFRASDKYFNSIEEAHDFYECGEGLIESVSGIKKVKVNGSDYNYDLSINASNIPFPTYDLQNYSPYNCPEPYIPLPTIDACNNLIVATLDSGCETQTPFGSQVLFNEGYDFVDNDPIAEDLNGHGTKVLSVVAGATNNNAMNISYIPIRVLDENGEGDLWTFFKGLAFAINRADIIVASLEALICDEDLCTTVFESFLARADAGNRLIVAAAGNSGALIDPGENYCIPASGQANNLITVGGSACFESPTDFSNYGPTNVDIFAPCQQISVYPPSLATGTSFAAPQIAAVAAIAGLTNPDFNAANVKTFILNNIIDRDWAAYCVTGGTFDYSSVFDTCPAGNRNGDTEEEMVLPDFSMNPYFSANNLNLSIHSPAEHTAKLQMMGLSGAILAEEDILLAPGKNEHQINTTELPVGLYLISLRTDNGKHLWNKVIKHQ